MSWQTLVGKWEDAGQQGQYLADVESYVRGGRRRYAALWRIGSGTGALDRQRWSDFARTFTELRASQDLIDVETIGTGRLDAGSVCGAPCRPDRR